MTSRHSSDDTSCAERQRVITRATSCRVPRDNELSLERRHVVCREMTSRHSSDDRSSRSFSYRSGGIPGLSPGDRRSDRTGWARGHVRIDLRGARIDLHDEEHHVADGAEYAQDLDAEEVARVQRVPVAVEKVLPGALAEARPQTTKARLLRNQASFVFAGSTYRHPARVARARNRTYPFDAAIAVGWT